jgi:hypothetical protein
MKLERTDDEVRDPATPAKCHQVMELWPMANHRWSPSCRCEDCQYATRIYRTFLSTLPDVSVDEYLLDICHLDPQLVHDILAEPHAREILEAR